MHVTLLYPDDPLYQHLGYKEAWVTGLERQGIRVQVRNGRDFVQKPDDLLDTDFVIPHVLVSDCEGDSALWRLAKWFEHHNVPLLNSTKSLELTSDKYKTYRCWERNGILQPPTWRLEGLEHWPVRQEKAVLKPSYCDGGRWVRWVRSLAEAHSAAARWEKSEKAGGESRGEPLLQQYIGHARCIRVIATPEDSVIAYEKFTYRGKLISHGDRRHMLRPSPKLRHLAQSMVAACGGGLMGVDILHNDDGYWALEINGPFGFDIRNHKLHDQLALIVKRAIA